MLSLTRKADYALVAMVYLGHQWRKAAGPVSARQVADSFDLPGPLLMKTLKELAQADLLRSTRGTTGGYELTREPGRISMLEIVAAVEQEAEVSPAAQAGSVGALDRLHAQIDSFLNGQTLADLLDAMEEGDDQGFVSLTGGRG